MDGASALNPRLEDDRPPVTRAASLFDGGGEMGELMRLIDWAKTPVGPVESWPQSLKTALSILLKQPNAVFIFWGPQHVQFYNDAYRPILGTNKHPSAMGQRGAECWPEIWDIVHPMLETVHRGNSTGVEDGLLVMNRGYLEEGYYTYTYSPIAEESGTVGGVFCIVYDTTARVIGERRLRTLRDLGNRTIAKDAEEACQSAAVALSGNSHDVPFAAIYLYSDDRKSATLAAVTGSQAGSRVSPSGIVFDGEDLSVIAQAAGLSRVLELPDLARQLGPLPGGPWPVGAESGIVLPLAIPGQSLPAGFLLAGVNPRKRLDPSYLTFFELVAGQIATAIAEARAFEEERKRAEALAELDRVKTAFFSNVSHEFRTPLTLMLGPLTELLSKPDISLEEGRNELAVAHRNCLRLLKLVNTLLDFSRIEAGRIQARYEPTDLTTLTSDLASVFRSAIERANLRFTVTCATLATPVFVDREMWEKIVLNLLSNAFKFTLEGEIAVILKAADGHVELSVSDTGIGIPGSEIAKVFDRFHQIEGAKGRSQEGSGIGLALVQELAQLHGGSVRVQSVYGKGSTFTVCIPLGSSHLPPERIGVPRTQQSTALGAQPFLEEALRWAPDASADAPPMDVIVAHPQLGRETAEAGVRADQQPRPRILLADDNSDMRDYLRRLLGEHYQAATVPDAFAALEAIRKEPPDLLLADVMMPGMDGFGLLEAIRGDPGIAMLPVILLSARAGEESRVEGLRAGADDYVVKPFSARELLVRISSRLEIAKLRKDAAEAELRNLRGLIENAPAAVALLSGADHVFQLVSHQYARVTGRAEASLIGKPVREALPEIGMQGFVDLLDGVYGTSEPFVGSEMLARLDRHGDGRLEDRYFNFVYQPWKDADGRTRGVFIHAVDVSEQVFARRRLEESIAERRRAEEAVELLNAQLTADLLAMTRVQQVSTRLVQAGDFARLLGELIDAGIEITRAGMGNIQLLENDTLRMVAQHGFDASFLAFFEVVHYGPEARGTALQRGERVIVEDVWDSPVFSGAPAREVLLAAGVRALQSTPLVSRSGELLGMFSTHYRTPHRPNDRELRLLDLLARQAADLIERTRSEEALRNSEARFRELAEVGPQFIWVSRPDGSLEYVNQRWVDYSGHDLSETTDIGRLAPAIHPADYGEMLKRWQHSLSSGEAFEMEARLRRMDGSFRWFLIRTVALRDDRGRIVKWFGASSDIHEQKRVEAELRRVNHDLEQFAYSASHDLQEPLRSVKIYSELLADRHGEKLDGQALEFLGFLRGGASRMEMLIHDLLAYTQVTKLDFPSENTDANDAFEDTLANLKQAIADTGARITADRLPAFRMHSTHLKQLFQNLIGNAIKYRNPDLAPRVHVGAQFHDGHWIVSVKDNGIGIEPEYKERIFGIFKRLHTGDEYSGTGIGLAICQRIVERYHGRIWVESDLGQGSTFFFTVPA